jgi:hypothetical protein
MHFILNSSFDNALFVKNYFDITKTHFKVNSHFSVSLCDKHNVIISKVHNESILFLKLIHNFKYDSH